MKSYAERKKAAQAQAQTARKKAKDPAWETESKPMKIHMRADSTGSISRAFYKSDEMPAKKGKGKKSKPALSAEERRTPSMADMADLALSSLGGLEELGMATVPVESALTQNSVSYGSLPNDNYFDQKPSRLSQTSLTGSLGYSEEDLNNEYGLVQGDLLLSSRSSGSGGANSHPLVPQRPPKQTRQPPSLHATITEGVPASQQQHDIAMFSSMVLKDDPKLTASTPVDRDARLRALPPTAPAEKPPIQTGPSIATFTSSDDEYLGLDSDDWSGDDDEPFTFSDCLANLLDPTPWLTRDALFDETGREYFDDHTCWTMAGLVRHYFYNPICPEFSSLQQFNWAIIIGVLMGFYTAIWKFFIEASVELVWVKIPEFLLLMGVFTDLDGSFPLYNYMWICPAIFGGIVSYIFVILPIKIPGEWPCLICTVRSVRL
jgi:hypothetical protein